MVELLATSFSASYPSNATVIKIASYNMWMTKLKDYDILQMSYGCKIHMPHIRKETPLISWDTILALNSVSGRKPRASCLGSGGKLLLSPEQRWVLILAKLKSHAHPRTFAIVYFVLQLISR